MRKWMRDRLKRKKPEAGKGAATPAPLQPAYFDAAPEGAGLAEVNSSEPEPPVEQEKHTTPEQVAEASPVRSPQPQREGGGAGGDQRRRRRRGRGGRGRGGLRNGGAPANGAPAASVTEGEAASP